MDHYGLVKPLGVTMDHFVSIDGTHGLTSELTSGISPLDRGFLYGDSLMETILVVKKHPVLFEQHLDRLRWGAEQLGIPFPWTMQDLEFEVQSILEAYSFERGSLRIVVTAGVGTGLERTALEPLRPTKIIYYGPLTNRPPSVYEAGVSLKRKVAPWIDRNPRIKLCHYAPEIVALQRAKKEGYDDILWSREDGELMESSVSNLFLIARQGDQVEIVTPPAHSGILLGVTRQKMIDLLYGAKIPVTEQIVYSDELPRFDEGFLTSSLSGLIPIRSIDRHQLHTARGGSTFRHLERLYRTWLSIFEASRLDRNN